MIERFPISGLANNIKKCKKKIQVKFYGSFHQFLVHVNRIHPLRSQAVQAPVLMLDTAQEHRL